MFRAGTAQAVMQSQAAELWKVKVCLFLEGDYVYQEMIELTHAYLNVLEVCGVEVSAMDVKRLAREYTKSTHCGAGQ